MSFDGGPPSFARLMGFTVKWGCQCSELPQGWRAGHGTNVSENTTKLSVISAVQPSVE